MRIFRKKIAEAADADADFSAEMHAPEPAPENVPEDGAAPISGRRRKPSVATHPIFVPLVTVWGAALFGLSVLVAPFHVSARASAQLGLDTLNVSEFGLPMSAPVAAIAAIIGAALCFSLAMLAKRFVGRRQKIPADTFEADQRIEPIDPAYELGSDSLDAPIEVEPFSVSEIVPEYELSEAFEDTDDGVEPESAQGDGFAADHFTSDDYTSDGVTDAGLADDAFGDDEFGLASLRNEPSQPSDGSDAQPDEFALSDELATPSDSPFDRELDLEEFANLPNREAVWIEDDLAQQRGFKPAPETDSPAEPASQPAPETVPAPAEPQEFSPSVQGNDISAATATERLRGVPPSDLSLVHMVERFALALYEHQDAERHRSASKKSPQRDAALAEALKALSLFTEKGFNIDPSTGDVRADALRDTTRELRDALSKLHDLRGAA